MLRILMAVMLLLMMHVWLPSQAQDQATFLVAHRGGVVDSTHTENGMSALKLAVQQGYRMIETDMRVTAHGILIAHHDADFKRYYGLDKTVVQMTWSEIKKLRSSVDGDRPLLLEQVLQFCKQNNMQVMLDNKIAGGDTILFRSVVALLDQYNLRKSALMIGTDESTAFFTGKIRLSCSRKQLEANMQKPGYRVDDFYLFERASNLRKDDVEWAKKQGIMTVAAINKYHYRQSPDMMKAAATDCKRLLEAGVTAFQIDSEFGRFFK